MTAFRTHTDRFVEANAQVLGISVDSFAAAGEFEEKLGLEFPLVSDFPKNETGKAYGVTLVGGDLRGLVRARRLSRATMANIRQNLAFAFGYNALGIPVAAGVLYPLTGMLLSPMLAAAAMSLSSVSVIANALRLRSARL